jgi:hypothetical protein
VQTTSSHGKRGDLPASRCWKLHEWKPGSVNLAFAGSTSARSPAREGVPRRPAGLSRYGHQTFGSVPSPKAVCPLTTRGVTSRLATALEPVGPLIKGHEGDTRPTSCLGPAEMESNWEPLVPWLPTRCATQQFLSPGAGEEELEG